MRRYAAIIEGHQGAYGVVFPDLPGCTAMGDSIDEAIANAVEALNDWTTSVMARGQKVPAPRPIEAVATDEEVVVAARSQGAAIVLLSWVRRSGKPVRANLSLDAGILEAIDAAAERSGVTRSAMVEILAANTIPEIA